MLAQLLGGALGLLAGSDARVLLLVLAAAGIALVVGAAGETLRCARGRVVESAPARSIARRAGSVPRTADPDAAGQVRARAPGLPA